MDEQKFKDRTKALALRVIRLVGALPKTERAADVIGKQLRGVTGTEEEGGGGDWLVVVANLET